MAPEPHALTGDRLAQLAIDHNWQGLVLLGNIRDSEKIKTMPLGVWALGTYPVRGKSGRNYTKDAPIRFASFVLNSGDWLYADADGIVISKQALHA